MSSERDLRAVFILDIDGTINPFYARHRIVDHPEELPGFEEHTIEDASYGKANVFLQTAVLRSTLRRLQAEGVELVWGSAWNESSNLILRMLFPEGAESWATVVFPDEIEFSLSTQSWKLSTVREFVERHYGDSVPVIWADDEIFGDAESWLDGRSGPGILIRPDRHRGITDTQWSSILDFVDGLS